MLSKAKAKEKMRAEILDILHSNFSEDGLWLASAEGKADDSAYMWRHGYTHTYKKWHPFVRKMVEYPGDINEKGREYQKKNNKEFDRRWKREKERTYNDDNIKKVARMLKKCYVKYMHDYRISWEDLGFDEDIRYAILRLDTAIEYEKAPTYEESISPGMYKPRMIDM